MLIAHLRKRSFPEHAPMLFARLWAEQADHLLAHLDPRWLVSAVTTFGDHGVTETQRGIGLALSTLFNMMKLYETERLYSGLRPDQPHPSGRRQNASLPLDMDPFALVGGGLDVNTLARLWQESEGDAAIAPLAHNLLTRLHEDPRALFHRLTLMRAEKEAQRADKSPPRAAAAVPQRTQPDSEETLRWGLVTTTNAPLAQIARFAAHHLDMGADALHIFLDAPAPDATDFLRHPKINLTTTDAAYWEHHSKDRPAPHQLRQAFNATRCLHADTALHWLGHIDVDEFLISDQPLAHSLFTAPQDAAFARIPPAEALATDGPPPRHFKLTHHAAGVKKAELQDVYPTFGMHLYGGFLSHTSGKVLARTGLTDTRLGIHALKRHGEDLKNRCRLPGVWLAHLHTPTWQHFRDHLGFRLTKGSYRARSERPELGQSELLTFLMQEEGEDGLRAFFDEVCADTPALRGRLAARGMLLTRDLDLDAKVLRHFGRLP
ncbi:glycosyltransferase family 2 protein [Sagittula salina]|uniref:glycosyltransferase family 2 protein n=1 Tax=Sagittula salina TaxID=2820268 RepID=UPI001FD85D41|nr:glycosyltransferase family 2 protein [Sagittula salina]